MARLFQLCSVSLAALAVAGSAAFAESASTNASDSAIADEGVVTAIQNMALAQQLASMGVADSDPILLLAAARLANQVTVASAELSARDGSEAPTLGDGPMHSAEEMLAAARDLAGDRDDLLGLIADVEAEGSRGSIYGSGYYDGYIGGGQNLYYDEAFYGGEQAVITLQGHHPSDIDLWVYDEFGNLVCSSTGYSSYESCSWTPRWTGDFTVRVENEGHARGTDFTLWTN